MKILLIEDDKQTQAYITKGLVQEGHIVDAAGTGIDGLELAQTRSYDLAIVDRMLPGIDGLSLVQTLRKNGCYIKVLFLTSLGGIDDRVQGFEAGGDDYLTKPFAFSELLARLNALARRPTAPVEITVLRLADLELDLLKRTVSRASTHIDVQPREFRLLEYMMRNEGRVLTKTMLLERVWDFHFDPKTNVVETHMSRLRAKIDQPFPIHLIKTVRGSGYKIDATN